ncbi:MAG: hypothetical protein H0U52_01795 [Chloroflexi bacterium]|nr:hypothetical protein [Chloroflexota bacterium]
MTGDFAIGFFVGFVVALPASMLSVLLAALWQRRSLRVVIGAMAGVAAIDAILVVLGLWIGSAIGGLVSDSNLRGTIGAGLFVGVAGWIALGLLLGPYGVSSNAVLPTTVLGAAARLGVVGALDPGVAFAAGAVAVVRLDLAPGGFGSAAALGFIAAGVFVRGLTALTASNRIGAGSSRSSQRAFGFVSILMLARSGILRATIPGRSIPHVGPAVRAVHALGA